MVELEEPDKGYAWVVAFAAFGINCILAGLIRSVGIIYIQVLEYFQVQRREATLPFSVRSVIRCFASPLVGIAGNRLGIRMVTAVGGLIAAIGVSLCRIAPNILWLTVFFGVIHGIGFALANTLFQVVVNQYFENYRSTASGIALSGSCIGSFIFPFILESTFEEYNLPGTFLILGGIILNVIPLGLLFKTPPWVRYPKQYAKLKLQQDAIKRSKHPTATKMLEAEQEKTAMLVGKSTLAGATTLGENPGEQLQVLSFQTSAPMKSTAKSLDSGMDLYRKANSSEADTVRRASEPSNSSKPSVETDDTAFKSSMMKSAQSRAHPDPEADQVPSSSTPSSKNAPNTYREEFKALILFYTNPMYVVVSIGVSVYQLVLLIVLSVIVDYAVDKGMPSTSGKYLIYGISIGDLIGRLCFGWVTDKGFLSLANFSMCLFIIQGVFLTLFPVFKSFVGFLILLFVFGMSSGSIIVLFPVIVYKYIPRHLQILAIGGLGFMSGIFSLFLPLIIGHFRDYLGSYDKMCYLLGGISAVTGLLYSCEPLFVKWYYSEQSVHKILNKGSVNL